MGGSGQGRLTGAERERAARQLRRCYEAGLSTRQLVAATGYSMHLVVILLHEAGTAMRPTGRPGHLSEVLAGRVLTGKQREEVAARLRRQYEAGAGIRRIADAERFSYGKVHDLLVQAGTQLRPRGARCPGAA